MQTDERPMAEERRGNRWRGPVIGIAAAAVVLIAGLIYLSTDREPVAEPAPNAVALPGGDFPTLAPGAYFADTDGNETTSTRGTFVIAGNEWGSLVAGAARFTPAGGNDDTYVSLMVVEVEQLRESPCDGGAYGTPGTSAKALGDQFAAMPRFVTLEGLAPVSAFGHDGYHLVLQVPDDCNDYVTQSVWVGGLWGERNYQEEGQIVEYWFLDVEGTTVMVEATRPRESGEEIVTEFNAELDAVLDTLVITP
jgi:hypothetical protein